MLKFVSQIVATLLLVAGTSAQHVVAQSTASTDAFGFQVELPAEWKTTESYTPSLPSFGVYMAEGDNGGYFWVQVRELEEGAVVTETMPDEASLSEGAELAPFPLASSVPGYRDGYTVFKAGIANHFFVAVHEGRLFRFRVGHNFKHASTDKFGIQTADITARRLVTGIAFLE